MKHIRTTLLGFTLVTLVSMLVLFGRHRARVAKAAVGTLVTTASSASISGALTFGQNETLRPADGSLPLEYKSGPDSYATGIFIQATTGNVGVGTEAPGQRLEVNGTIKATAFQGDGASLTGLTATVPASAVVLFNLSSCPTGWSEATAARGRIVVGLPASGTLAGTVGTALPNQGTNTVTGVISHTHAVDPASTTSASDGAAHTHAVDPPSTTSSSDGSHTHTFSVNTPAGSTATPFSGNASASVAGTVTTSSDGSASHNVDIASFTSGASTHSHTLDVASFTSDSAGTSTVDVTMPYVQLIACQKD